MRRRRRRRREGELGDEKLALDINVEKAEKEERKAEKYFLPC